MKRLAYLDQMKGVAILLVVVSHVLFFSFGTAENFVSNPLSPFRMPVFFYISGYLAYKSIPTMKEWWCRLWKKTHGLLFPYLVFAGLYCIFKGKDFIHLLSTGGAEYWFMYVLFLLSAFFMVYEQLAKHFKHPFIYVAAWLLPYVSLILVQRRYGEVWGGIFAVNQLVAFYRFYLLGYLCKKFVRVNDFIFNNKYVYAIGFVAFFIRWYMGSNCNMLVSFVGIVGAIIILQHFFATSERPDSRPMRLLSYIGQNSLEIYLIQYFFLPDLTGFIKPYIDVPNGFIWQLSLALILTIPITAACLFIGTIIKRNNLLSWVMLGK